MVVGGSPLGPWTDPLGKKIIPDTVSRDYVNNGGFPAGMWLFDPEVFIDDDGQAYLYFGGNSQIGSGANVQGPQNPKSTRVVKLKDDMVTLDGDPSRSTARHVRGVVHLQARRQVLLLVLVELQVTRSPGAVSVARRYRLHDDR